MVKRCVAAGCSNTTKEGYSLFKFPRDPNLRRQWAKQICRTRAEWTPTESSVLCSTHFTEDCFELNTAIAATFGMKIKRRLKPDAIPTVFERPISGASESTASCGEPSRKRQAAGKSSMKAGLKKRSSAYEKRERLWVNIIVF